MPSINTKSAMMTVTLSRDAARDLVGGDLRR